LVAAAGTWLKDPGSRWLDSGEGGAAPTAAGSDPDGWVTSWATAVRRPTLTSPPKSNTVSSRPSTTAGTRPSPTARTNRRGAS